MVQLTRAFNFPKNNNNSTWKKLEYGILSQEIDFSEM